MLRLFLLSMAFCGAVAIFMGALIDFTESNPWWWSILLGFTIGGAGIITFGIMLIKHIISIFKK